MVRNHPPTNPILPLTKRAQDALDLRDPFIKEEILGAPAAVFNYHNALKPGHRSSSAILSSSGIAVRSPTIQEINEHKRLPHNSHKVPKNMSPPSPPPPTPIATPNPNMCNQHPPILTLQYSPIRPAQALHMNAKSTPRSYSQMGRKDHPSAKDIIFTRKGYKYQNCIFSRRITDRRRKPSLSATKNS